MTPEYCKDCGKELRSSGEPVTVSGWYGDLYFVWRENPHRPEQINTRCRTCTEKCERDAEML